jgi:flagellar hook-basal body complex protein FliE
MQDMKIQNQVPGLVTPKLADKTTLESNSAAFGNALQQSLDRVNRLQLDADQAISDLAAGRQSDIHGTMIAAEKASISFELLMQIRNKVIDAYDKIMRTQV